MPPECVDCPAAEECEYCPDRPLSIDPTTYMLFFTGLQPTWPDCNADLDDTTIEDAAAIVLGTLLWGGPPLVRPVGLLRGCLVRLSASTRGCHVSWPSMALGGCRVEERALMGDDPLRIILDLKRVRWESEILWDVKRGKPAGDWHRAGSVL